MSEAAPDRCRKETRFRRQRLGLGRLALEMVWSEGGGSSAVSRSDRYPRA